MSIRPALRPKRLPSRSQSRASSERRWKKSNTRRPALEVLESRLLLASEIVYYDYVEDGVLKGGRIELEIDPSDVEPASGTSPWDSTTILDNGPTSNRIDLVFVGDGYTTSQLGVYATHVDNILPTFLGESPLDAYSTFFNVHRVDVISNESGVDNDPTQGISRDTALDMGYFCNGIERLLCVNVTKALSAADDAPDADQVMAIANSTKYGGAGYGGANLATLAGDNANAVEIALHEFGHSFADLADEYDYGGPVYYTGPEPADPNVSTYQAAAMDSLDVKWHLWLDEPNVDTFEGAMYSQYDIYRPTENSKMRSLNRPFEQVNVEQFVVSLYKTVRPIDDATPSGNYPSGTVFFVEPVRPTTHDLDIQWYLDGSPIPGASETTFDASTLSLSAGNHILASKVIDNTELVRDETLLATLMTEERTWTLEVVSDPPVDFGDAPSPYATTRAEDGARHPSEGPRLGTLRDEEADGQPSDAADGDDTNGVDDEDGVTLPALTASIYDTTTASVTIDLQNAGPSSNQLDAWIDFNQDGDWDDLGEQIFTSYSLGTTDGIQSLTFTVPQDSGDNIVYGTTYARFRLSTAGGLLPTGLADDGEVEDYQVTIYSQVVGRHIFYNGSAWDGSNAEANASDDNAIALDKQALVAGQQATFANYISYSRGINGIMIDVAGLVDPAGLSVEDFEFRVGNNNDPASWPLLALDPSQITIAVREGEGVEGSDRVTVIFPDATVKKIWLQVTVKATAATGLATPDVHYWGNAIGDSGNSASDTAVNGSDQLGVRIHPRGPLNPAPIDDAYDYNRDKYVNGGDELVVRLNPTFSATDLNLIDLTGYGGGEAEGEAPLVWSGGPLSGTELPLSPAMPHQTLVVSPDLPSRASDPMPTPVFPPATLVTQPAMRDTRPRTVKDLEHQATAGQLLDEPLVAAAANVNGSLNTPGVQLPWLLGRNDWLCLSPGSWSASTRPSDDLAPSSVLKRADALVAIPVSRTSDLPVVLPEEGDHIDHLAHRIRWASDQRGQDSRRTLDEALEQLLAEWEQY